MSRNEVCALTGTDSSEPAALKRFQKNWDGAEKITMHHACQEAQRYLTSCKIADAAVDAWYLLEYVTGVSRTRYLADRDKRLSKEQWDAYAALIEKRGAHIPLQHLTGEQEFMGLSFLVNGDVLIPRQDTELLVETALETLKADSVLTSRRTKDAAEAGAAMASPGPENVAEAGAAMTSQQGVIAEHQVEGKPLPREGNGDLSGVRPYRVLDLCTGSGCIAISIAKLSEPWRSRKQSQKTDGMEIYASDISEAALNVARNNAFRLGADVHFIQSDLFDGFLQGFCNEQSKDAKGSAPARFDVIVSNPPYICTDVIEELDEEVRVYEPHLALDGGEDGLALYRRIIRESVNWLKPGGWLLLEIGYDQGETVPELMRRYGFCRVQVTKDLAGLNRVVSGQRCVEEGAGMES